MSTPDAIADATLKALGDHLLVDGFPMVMDPVASQGSWLVDTTGQRWLDLFTFYASNALGMNHPGLVDDDAFREELLAVAMNKPSNSDVYTPQQARFVATLARVLGDPELPRYLFIEGGSVAVGNAVKLAFDWKSQRNEQAGRSRDLGMQVMHLRHAFHGRTGYALSLTNTDPIKTDRFPKFAWPRISSPAVTFPIVDHLDAIVAAEEQALDEARAAFAANPHDIACFPAEPIQCEGGDRHLRPEFLQAMQALCVEHDALFILDEVQTGAGMTGSPWAYQQLGLEPDVIAFGKKLHVCGIMAGRRVNEVETNALAVSSRLNSTFGGNLTDQVRATKILEIIERDDLMTNASTQGAWLVDQLTALAAEHPTLVSNVRGRGLIVSFDLPTKAVRNDVTGRLFREEHTILLGCGERSVRFRPSLAITREDLTEGLARLTRVLRTTTT